MGAALDLLISSTTEATLASKLDVERSSARALLSQANNDTQVAQASLPA